MNTDDIINFITARKDFYDDDIEKIISLIASGEDLDDDVKVRVYTASNKIKNKPNKPNKPNRGFEGGISRSGKFKDFYSSGDVKVEKAIYRPEAQKANHEANNQLNGSYKDLATVKDGVNAVKQILEQAMIVLNDLEEKLKNV